MKRKTFLIGLVVAALATTGAALGFGAESYELKLVMRSAAQLVPGSPVWMDGAKVGEVEGLETRNGKAVTTVSVDSDQAPLHEGTTSVVEWKSVLGERVVTLRPGPSANPELPDGAIVEAASSQVELDQVLAALDAPTRARLSSLVQQLNGTLNGSESDLQATLRSTGPAVAALGEVLKAVGRDGPAIRALVTRLNDMIGTSAERQGSIRSAVNNLTRFTGAVAGRQDALRRGLGELPPTLRETKSTLDRVPAVSGSTVPLLRDLRPAVDRLRPVARNLSPVLADLHPALAEMRPMLGSLQQLLGRTPAFLDTAHGVLPGAEQALRTFGPAVSFLRPYTPELAGWLTNWNKQYSAYDSQGHMWVGAVAPGPAGTNESLVMGPPLKKEPRPLPGRVVGQPWTDANGSPVR